MPSHEGVAQRNFIGPLFRTVKVFLTISFIFLLFQIWINPPERRAVVSCFAPYKTSRLVFQGVRKLTPKEHELHITMSNKIEYVHDACVFYIGKIPGFH